MYNKISPNIFIILSKIKGVRNMNKQITEELTQKLGSHNVEINSPMSKYTTFKVGGPADFVISPHTVEQIKDSIEICNKYSLKYYVIGNGSNIIVRDSGFKGVIIKLHKNFCEVNIEQQSFTAQAGASLSALAKMAFEHSLTGLEFAAGIPGTLGGAVTMNAGAYGREMCDVLVNAKILDEQGQIITLSSEELELGYRTSIFAKHKYILLESTIRLEDGNQQKIKSVMDDLMSRRREKQPLEYPSAGSTFKRPEGFFAGKLIMDSGLAGYRIGDACVSPKHCGFVINLGNATAEDILQLITYVKEKVYEQFHVELETEVKLLEE